MVKGCGLHGVNFQSPLQYLRPRVYAECTMGNIPYLVFNNVKYTAVYKISHERRG